MDYESAQALVDEISRDPNIARSAIRLGQLYTERPEVFDALHNREIAPGVRKNNPGPDASHTAEKLVRNAQAATADYVRGMQNPRRDPKAAAVAAKGKWADQLQKAIQNDSYGKAVGRYDLGEAVAIATGDGGAAFASGVAKRKSKIERVHATLMPQLGAISQRIQSMPQDNEGQRTQRMLENLTAMRTLGRARKGGGSGV